MELELNKITEKMQHTDFITKFIKKLNDKLEKSGNDDVKNERIAEIKLTPEEDMLLYNKKWEFLEKFFKKELSDLSNGEIFIVTDKYEKDYEYHRYKVTQYLEGHERKYIAFEKDLPENVQLGDVVRKIDGKYIYDNKASQYVKNTFDKIKQDIINKKG